jgi:phosphatidylglycerophosphatase A
VFRDPVHFLAFGFGSGLSPKAPGTAGTVVAVPLLLLFINQSWYIYAFIVVAMFVLGVYLCDKCGKDLQVHDHSGIVWDEMVGYWLTMFLIPVSWVSLLAGFVLFRLFDIWKPWPIGWVDQRVTGGLGVMLDDVLAAIYAWLCLALWYFVLPGFLA